jgi:predicted small metal-binding protein
MGSPTTTTTTKTGNTKGTREAWTVACANAGMDCSFSLTNHNKNELVQFSLNHLKGTHNATKTEKDVLAIAKPTKW